MPFAIFRGVKRAEDAPRGGDDVIITVARLYFLNERQLGNKREQRIEREREIIFIRKKRNNGKKTKDMLMITR